MARRVAFLVANQTFMPDSKLANLDGPVNDVEALGKVLEDPQRGGFEVSYFRDQMHYEIMPALEDQLRVLHREDLVLIFYSGHGKLDFEGRLYMATANTKHTALKNTSIAAWALKETVLSSPCQQTVLLLDCCYSGAIGKGLKGALTDQLQAVQSASGMFILTASTGIETASEKNLGGKTMGRFTAALIEGIETGQADTGGKGSILLSDVRRYVERETKGQTPQFFAQNGYGDPVLSQSDRKEVAVPQPIVPPDEPKVPPEKPTWSRRVAVGGGFAALCAGGIVWKIWPDPVPPPSRRYLVYFDFNEATLTSKARTVLQECASASADAQVRHITVTAYDSDGVNHQERVKLADARAAAVVNFLVSQGVPRAAIAQRGYDINDPNVFGQAVNHTAVIQLEK